MAILNSITRAEGNKAYPATAVAYLALNGARTNEANQVENLEAYRAFAGGKQLSYLGVGSQLQTNVETFDQGGASLGIQGLNYVIDGTEPDFNLSIGGMEFGHAMRNFCKAISQGWDPTVSCWPSRQTNECMVFNIQPRGGNGAPFPTTIDYNLVRIRDFVFVPVAPVPPVQIGPNCHLSDQSMVINQTAGSAMDPAVVSIKGMADFGDVYSLLVDTDAIGFDPITLSVTAGEADDCSSIAQKFCDAFNANDQWDCETQNGQLFLTPAAPATAVSVSAAAIVKA